MQVDLRQGAETQLPFCLEDPSAAKKNLKGSGKFCWPKKHSYCALLRLFATSFFPVSLDQPLNLCPTLLGGPAFL